MRMDSGEATPFSEASGVCRGMCQEAWCLSRVLDVTLHVAASLSDGHPTEHAVCAGLAHRFDVVTAAVITIDPVRHTATITAWPRGADILGMKLVLDRLPQAFPLLMRHLLVDRRPSCLSRDADPSSWHGTIAAILLHEVLACEDIAQLPLADDGPRVRLAVLATRTSYDERALHALAHLCQPLATVIRLRERSVPTDPPREATASPRHRALDAVPQAAPSLTARELEVLRMVADGMLAQTIASRLQVSPRTVHKHLGNVYRKLDAHDRLVAVRRAERLGLLLTGPSPTPAPRRGAGILVPAPSSLEHDALTLRW